MKKMSRSLLIAVAVVAGAATTYATTVIPPTFDELVAQAETIFEGTVTDVKSEWAGEGGNRRIVSYVTFRVDDTLKGSAQQSYTIRMLGGTVDGQTLEVADGPKFQAGDRDIVFVEKNGSQFIPLVGIMHGRFKVMKDKVTGREIVAANDGRGVSDLASLGKQDLHGHAAQSDKPALSLAEFKGAVKNKLAGSDDPQKHVP